MRAVSSGTSGTGLSFRDTEAPRGGRLDGVIPFSIGVCRPGANAPTVAYAADAAPGMMKMESALVDSEVGGEPQAVDTLRPRARPTVWPGCRYVPGIVAPGLPGSTRSRMSPSRCPPPPASTGLSESVAQ